MTEWDETMLDRLSVVRIADMGALRFALAGLEESSQPVSERRVRQWCRLIEVGRLERERISMRERRRRGARYRLVFESHTFRLRESELARVVYLCTPDAARTVRGEGARWMPTELLPRLDALDAIDVRGRIATRPTVERRAGS